MAIAFGPVELGPAILLDIAAFTSRGLKVSASGAAPYVDAVEAFLTAVRLYGVPQYEGASASQADQMKGLLKAVWADPPADPWQGLEAALHSFRCRDASSAHDGPAVQDAELVVDARFSDQEYQRSLDEVREYLPAFLSPAATENHDPVGDVTELMALEQSELDRVMAVHVCLSEAATVFGAALEQSMRRPLTSTERPEVLTQAVRGPIDWGATIRRRAQSGWDLSQFAVRPSRRVFDTPENRALVWVLDELELAVSRSGSGSRFGGAGRGWVGGSARGTSGSTATRAAYRVAARASQPAAHPRVQQRLAASRLSFTDTRSATSSACCWRWLTRTSRRSRRSCASATSSQHRAWKLFEVLVALRLARELRPDPEHGLGARRQRVVAGWPGTVALLGSGLPDGGELSLTYQGWPPGGGASVRQRTASRHAFSPKPSVPDLFVSRASAAARHRQRGGAGAEGHQAWRLPRRRPFAALGLPR